MQPGVNGKKVVASGDLEAMAGVKQYAHVGLRQQLGEFADLGVEGPLIEIEPKNDGKARLLQGGAMSLASLAGLMN